MKTTIMAPINYRFKNIYMINQKKKLFRQQVPESTCGRNITTDTDILTSWNGNRKIMQHIRITNGPSTRVRSGVNSVNSREYHPKQYQQERLRLATYP